jgi:hypothetical protein
VLPEHMDVALAALWQHFRRRQRWAAAASFFRQLASVYPAATLLWGAAQRCLGLGGWSGSTGNLLAELLLLAGHRGPEQLCPATLVGLATECLEAGRVQEAAVMARQALQVRASAGQGRAGTKATHGVVTCTLACLLVRVDAVEYS